MQVFKPLMWACLSATVFTTALVFCMMKRETFSFLGLGIVLAHLITLDIPIENKYLKFNGVRFGLLTSCGFGFFIFSAYTADLTTYLTTRNSNIDITSFADLLQGGQYKLNVLEGSQAHAYFKNYPGNVEQEIYKKFFEGEENR